MTDAHATLNPVYYREPDTLIGVGDEAGKPPFLTGAGAPARLWDPRGNGRGVRADPPGLQALAARYGRMGGYAHLATLVKRVRDERPGRTLLLDGGDTLQGSATALWTRGQDMVRVMNQLGVEVFTPHWEFTYGLERVKELFGDREQPRPASRATSSAHNARELNWDEPVFAPYTIKRRGRRARSGVIGQAFPYMPVSHPRALRARTSRSASGRRRRSGSSTSCATSRRSTSSCS